MSKLTEQAAPPIKDHLKFAIVAAVCFFPPTGAFAVHYARKIKGLVEKGDFETAQMLSRKVVMLSWVTVVIGVVMTVSTIRFMINVVMPWLLKLLLESQY